MISRRMKVILTSSIGLGLLAAAVVALTVGLSVYFITKSKFK